MKNIKWLMMLMTAMSLSFAACTEPEEDNPQDKPTPNGLTFEVEVGEVTSSSVDFAVTPSDLEADYLVVLYDVATADEFTKDEHLVTTLYQELEAEARSKGMTRTEYLAENVDRGVADLHYENIAPETEYYIIVFGVDAADEYNANTELTKTKFTTLPAPKLDVEFEINTTVDGNSAMYEVIPSDDESIWYFYTLPKSTYDAYTDPEGDYRMSEQRFLLFCLEREIEAYRGAGYSDNQILNAIFHKGALTLKAEGLNAQTEYINMIAGFIVTEEGNVTIATDVTTSTYTTGDAKASELTFDISVTDVDMMRAAIKITPSNNKDTFCWMCAVWDGMMTATEIMDSIVAMYGGWMNSGAMLYTGVQDFTGGPGSLYKYKLDSPDTDYYVIAFGYAGGVTTEPEMVTFRTLPAPDPATTEFQMSASDITPYSFKLGITASHETTYYYADICSPDEYNEESLIKLVNEGFDEMFEMQKQYNPDATPAMILDSYYYNGNINSDASGIEPETEVMGFIFALDPNTGHVVKAHTFNPLATTLPVGSVTPGVEIVGYYSGLEENGTIFGDASQTAEKAITVVKYTELDGARSLFATMLGGNLTNLNTYSDPMVWRDAAAFWKPVSIAQPYSFYLADWDYEQTALAYVVDQSGVAGGIGRLRTMPTAENKGDIEELRNLVDSLNNAAKSLVLPESVVIRSESMILSNIAVEDKLDAVAEPQAEVEVKVEKPAVNNIVIAGGNYIRPFYL